MFSTFCSIAINLSHEKEYLRARAAGALGEFGGDAQEMIPALLVVQKFDPCRDVREQATRALYLIDPKQSYLEARRPAESWMR